MRRRALSLLLRLEQGGAWAHELLAPDEAPFVRELVLGVLRRRLTLDTIAAAFSRKPLDVLDPEVRVAIRVGLHQLVFMDGVPPHAAVSETVGAMGPSARRGFANAVLRSCLREMHRVTPDLDRGGAHPSKRFERPGKAVFFFSRPVFPDPAADRTGWLAAVHSHPPFLVARWVARSGEEAAVARLEAGNRTPPLVLRPRAGRVDADQLVERLVKEGQLAAVLPRPHGPAAVIASGARGLFRSRAFRAGLFSVQAAEQMDAVDILAPRPGESVWDACAAPGGKTTQIAERLGGSGLLLATDRDPRRLQPMHEALQRLGLDGVRVETHDVLADAPPPGRPEHGFDAILLDAPCSNTAVLDRRPEARWRLQPGTFAELATLQRRLLEAAGRHLAPGGRLVYSVCSHEPEEGEGHGLLPTHSPFVFRLPAGWDPPPLPERSVAAAAP